MRNSHKGFTLAEVLITLGIIGVVAAMTIPTLVNNYQKQHYVVQLKKNYSMLSQAFTVFAADRNCIGDIQCALGEFGASSLATKFLANDAFARNYLKTAKIVHNNGVGLAFNSDFFGSFYDSWYKAGTDTAELDPNGGGTYQIALIDGTSMKLNLSCLAGTNPPYNICGSIELDVNGAKPPNLVGRDYFGFYIMKNTQVVPVGKKDLMPGYDWDGESSNNCTNTPQGDAYAHGCAARIMEEGWQMNY